MVGKLTPDNIVTASTIPVILNASPYQTPNDFLRKVLDIEEGKPVERLPQNQPMFWGDTLEPVILTEAARRLDLKAVELDINEPYFHDHLPMACSLDGRAVGGKAFKHDPANGIYVPQGGIIDTTGTGVLEAKNCSLVAEDVPAPHRGVLQLQAQLMCVGATWGAVCVLYRGNELRVFLYRADEEVQRTIFDAVHEFERRKRDVDWYPVYTSDDANTAWANVDDGAPPLDLNEVADADMWASRLIAAKEEKRAIEAEIDEAEAELKQILGNHEEGSIDVDGSRFYIKWPMRRYKAQPAKTTEAKPERVVRSKTLTVKEAS